MPKENHLLSLEQIQTAAREVMLTNGFHLPTIIAQSESAQIVGQVPELGGSSDEKQAQLFALGFLLSQERVLRALHQVYLVTEAWSVVFKNPSAVPTEVRPSQHPDRVEVLIIAGLNVIEQIGSLTMYEMVREAEQVVELLEHSIPSEVGEVKSALLEAFVLGFQTGQRRFPTH
ncbi:MAG: hypothetical protein H6673_09800 [Anaerolineales bacterium]|nr:hypothetical protein [Anaerolineales bacterium]